MAKNDKADVQKRRNRIRQLLALRATQEQIIEQLRRERFKHISTRTYDRDAAAIRREDLHRLYALGQNEFVSEYESIRESIKERIRQLTLIASQAQRPYDRIAANKEIIEAETILADLLAYGPTVLAVRRAMEKKTDEAERQ
jgi:hypothetical protein